MRNEHKQHHTKEINNTRGMGQHCEGDKYIVRKTFLVYFHESSCNQTSDVATFGFDEPRYGQGVGMAVVLKDQEQATVRALYQWMQNHLAEHKMPVRWYLLDAIPRTSRGKINRSIVMEQCLKLTPLNLHRVLQNSEKGPDESDYVHA